MTDEATPVRGKFITFEGIDGAGKSSHLAEVASFLRLRGRRVRVTREPGGTPLAEKLREILLRQAMHRETEALLLFAARREHLAEVIEPALANGEWVLCDRFSDATYAYQCGGRGVECGKVELLEQWVHPHLQPDLTLLFDLPSAAARSRIDAQRRAADRFEDEQAEFYERVRCAYLERAAQAPARFRVLDASRSVELVAKEITAQLALFDQ